MSYTTIQRFWRDLAGLDLSRGQLAKIVQKASAAIQRPYDQLRGALAGQDHLGIDESGHKNAGKRHWTWCFRAPRFTVFHIDPSRGSEVLRCALGETFGGVIGCDYFSAYHKYMAQSGATVQFCMAHLIRDIRFLAEQTNNRVARWGERLLDWMRKLFHTLHRRDSSTPEPFTRRYDECTEGRGLLHTGMAYSYRHLYHNSRTFSGRADEHIGLSYINTGALSLADNQLFGLESALVYDPFSIQSEYFHVLADPTATGRDDVKFNAAYVLVSYFLTGEHRPYRREQGVFDRIKPFENLFRVRAEDGCVYTGKGAWELAYRFDYCDAGEAGPTARMVGASTYGVNWYLNP